MSRKALAAVLTLAALAVVAGPAQATMWSHASYYSSSYYYPSYYYPSYYYAGSYYPSYYYPSYYYASSYYPSYYRASSYYPSYYYASSYYPSYYYAPAPVVRYYYASTPVYVEPAEVCVTPVVGAAPTSGYAQPYPAPASTTKEPPVDKKKLPPPKVTESRSFSPSDPMNVTAADGTSKGVRVGFWNITGRDVTLTVNGKAMVVPANRNLTLTVSREFSWYLDGQTAREERVPDDKSAHEIVLR
jgi:hypothetical protein